MVNFDVAYNFLHRYLVEPLEAVLVTLKVARVVASVALLLLHCRWRIGQVRLIGLHFLLWFIAIKNIAILLLYVHLAELSWRLVSQRQSLVHDKITHLHTVLLRFKGQVLFVNASDNRLFEFQFRRLTLHRDAHHLIRDFSQAGGSVTTPTDRVDRLRQLPALAERATTARLTSLAHALHVANAKVIFGVRRHEFLANFDVAHGLHSNCRRAQPDKLDIWLAVVVD